MITSTKKRALAAAALSTVALGTALSSTAGAASAPAYGTPAPFHVYTSGNVTLPSVSNPTAQFSNTGVVKKSVTGSSDGFIQSWTNIDYANGTHQSIIVTKPGTNGQQTITNFIHSKNGTSVKFEVRKSNVASERSSILAVQYTAKTKTAANVRKGPSTNTSIVKTLPANSGVTLTKEFNTGNASNSTLDNDSWGSVWGSDYNGYMADSTLNINPLN